ncbi:MAG: GNAT family N-acetyltransferase [Oscillospiraceae bacterium]|nr:GNAT family N-acetyltransferase [Oscillospiraceae bacterium]
MEFYPAAMTDIDRICEITEQAKAQLKSMGLDQWQKGYPNREVWDGDIRRGAAYVGAEEGTVIGTYTFQTEPDASYCDIEGRWLSDKPYATIHRLCIHDDVKGRGAAGEFFAHAFTMAKNLGFASVRVDTHAGNTAMLRAVEKAGFVHCGTVTLREGIQAGDKREAFEKLL